MNEVVEMSEKVNVYREPKSAEVDMSKVYYTIELQ